MVPSYRSKPFCSPSQRVGRWQVRDPIGYVGGINLYGYGQNRPINLTDPLGLLTQAIGVSGAIGIGGLGGALSVGVTWDDKGGLGMEFSATGKLGLQLGADLSPYYQRTSNCDISGLNGYSAGAFIDAWKAGSLSGELNPPSDSLQKGGFQYGNLGPGILVGTGVQGSQTAIWRWK